MSLIKCPECGKEVSTAAEVCPHCGFPIKDSLKEKQYVGPDPIDASWMEYWKNAPSRKKWALTIVYFINLLLLVLFLVAGFSGGEFPSWDISCCIITGFASVFTFSFWLAGLICIKCKTANYDGYNVIAIAGFWNNYLVIENQVFEKVHNRHLDGKLPNGKNVKADFAFWDSSIRITLCE